MRSPRRHIPVLSPAVGAFVLATLVAVAIPAVSQTTHKEAQAKAVAQAKQIGLALKLFAGDNDGIYPKGGVPTELRAPTTSNAAFAVLFPIYVMSEKIFGNDLSAYQTRTPDNVIDPTYTGKPIKTLEAGENVYAYVMGLEDAFSPAYPLIVDGTDGTGHYVSDPARHGGVWKSEEAIVIRLDCSGKAELLTGSTDGRYVPMGDHAAELGGKPDNDLLNVSRYGKNLRLLEPAVGAVRSP